MQLRLRCKDFTYFRGGFLPVLSMIISVKVQGIALVSHKPTRPPKLDALLFVDHKADSVPDAIAIVSGLTEIVRVLIRIKGPKILQDL